jgi:drug/metabolite transporter (DMT)-like permease
VSSARVGILLMLLGMALFSLNDALGKWLVSSHSVGQVLLIRSLAALVVLAPFLWAFGLPRLFAVNRPGLQALRVLFSTVEVVCFYLAVRDLPLADVMTFWLAAPIYVALVAPLLLGERVGRLRWTAIAIGFVGVLVALGPTGGVSPLATGAAMVGSGCFAAMIVTGRTLRGTPDTALVFWQTVGAGLAGAVAVPWGWTPPGAFDAALLALLGVVAMIAHLCVTRALKLADAALVAPLQYTLLPWAALFGWVFFGDVPAPAVLVGALFIIVAGLLLVLAERRDTRAHDIRAGATTSAG